MVFGTVRSVVSLSVPFMLLMCICHIFVNQYDIIPCTGANSDVRIVDLFLRHLQIDVLRLTDCSFVALRTGFGTVVVILDVQLTTINIS